MGKNHRSSKATDIKGADRDSLVALAQQLLLRAIERGEPVFERTRNGKMTIFRRLRMLTKNTKRLREALVAAGMHSDDTMSLELNINFVPDNDEYDVPADIRDELDRAEDAIAEEVAAEEKELREEDEFFGYDDRGMCPVCSMAQGKDVPIPKGQSCPQCGGFVNETVDHDVPVKVEVEDVEGEL